MALHASSPTILFINIEEQTWAIVDRNETILKKAPGNISYTSISGDTKILYVVVNGYKYESGCPGIMFFPDGGCEYSEIGFENIQDGRRYLIKLSPYAGVLEIEEAT
ncbi:MAG: hypothetical protein ACP5JO_01770 [Candidatus Ratteibacteria bacterium]